VALSNKQIIVFPALSIVCRIEVSSVEWDPAQLTPF
jgi:hypothetical protein